MHVYVEHNLELMCFVDAVDSWSAAHLLDVHCSKTLKTLWKDIRKEIVLDIDVDWVIC